MLIFIDYYFNLHYHFASYISYRIILSLFTSFFVNLYLYPILIKLFIKLEIFQVIRNNKLKTHYFKNKTPTMGGLLIIFSILFSTILYCDWSNNLILYVLIILIFYGFIGLIDDYKKIKYKNTCGLPLAWKYFLLSIIALGFIYFLHVNHEDFSLNKLIIPFYHQILEINYLYVLLLSYFVLVGSSNAVNLTDGLDGLATMPIILVTFGLGFISLFSDNIDSINYMHVIYLKKSSELGVLCSSIIGSGLGFLWFNSYPSKIFMGDVGSLSLGGTIGAISIILHQEILLAIIGGVFVLETISVMLQIISFKIRKTRIFNMSPIHHHYEIQKIPEPLITVRFWIASIMLLLIGFLSLKVD